VSVLVIMVEAFSVDSSLPEDGVDFQGHRDAVAVRDHSRRVVRGWAGGRHRDAVDVAGRRAGELAGARHLLPNGRARRSIGVELDSHRFGIEVA
jgi:hypothetical protein